MKQNDSRRLRNDVRVNKYENIVKIVRFIWIPVVFYQQLTKEHKNIKSSKKTNTAQL